jgi:hypothetical protein
MKEGLPGGTPRRLNRRSELEEAHAHVACWFGGPTGACSGPVRHARARSRPGEPASSRQTCGSPTSFHRSGSYLSTQLSSPTRALARSRRARGRRPAAAPAARRRPVSQHGGDRSRQRSAGAVAGEASVASVRDALRSMLADTVLREAAERGGTEIAAMPPPSPPSWRGASARQDSTRVTRWPRTSAFA